MSYGFSEGAKFLKMYSGGVAAFPAPPSYNTTAFSKLTTFSKTKKDKTTLTFSCAFVLVSVYPRFLKTPSDVTVKAGTTARLECAAEGQPVPEIAWQKDGGYDFPAARERRMHVMPSDDVFFIVDVKSEDQGVYACTAKNAAGVVRVNATLAVLRKLWRLSCALHQLLELTSPRILLWSFIFRYILAQFFSQMLRYFCFGFVLIAEFL